MLPFDPAELTAIRIRPVDFAKLCGVTRQAVSKWIKNGTITLGPDGRLDPAAAYRQLLSNTNPVKLRARIVRDAVEPVAPLHDRIAELEAQIASIEKLTRYRCDDDTAERLTALVGRLVHWFDELIDAEVEERLPEALQHHVDQVFYPDCAGDDEEEYNGDGEGTHEEGASVPWVNSDE